MASRPFVARLTSTVSNWPLSASSGGSLAGTSTRMAALNTQERAFPRVMLDVIS